MKRPHDLSERLTTAGRSAFAMRVLDVVDDIPRGKVASYGDIAAHLGGSHRVVARVLATLGGEVPWWRVLRSDGSCAPGVEAQQVARLRAEGVAFRSPGRVDMKAARHVFPGSD